MEEQKEKWKGAVWILGICLVIAFFIFTHGNGSSTKNDSTSDYNPPSEHRFYGYDEESYYEERKTIDRYDAINDYWDEIREYVNGTETIEACSWESGNCYDLDAEISDGYIEQIYFPEGGYLYFSTEIDSDGQASDYDMNGDSWGFTLDMDSSIVEDAVYDWASDNDYELE